MCGINYVKRLRPRRAEPLLLRSESFLHLADFPLDLAADLFDPAFGCQAGIVRDSSNFLFNAAFYFAQRSLRFVLEALLHGLSPPIRPTSRDRPLAVRVLPNSFA